MRTVKHMHLIEHACSKVTHLALKSSTAANSSNTILPDCKYIRVFGEIFLTIQYILGLMLLILAQGYISCLQLLCN